MFDGDGRSEATDDGSEAGTDSRSAAGNDEGYPQTDHPVRRGSVDIQLRDGAQIHHDEAFVRYEPDAFVVATDASFSANSTDCYPKETVAWLDVRHPRH